MLSPNSILHQGRYRIVHKIWTDATGSFYDAHDNLFGQSVVISESVFPRSVGAVSSGDGRSLAERFDYIKSLTHNAIIGVRDHFTDSDRQYIVTDMADGTSVSQLVGALNHKISANRIARGIERIFDALSHIVDSPNPSKYLGITAANIRVAPGDEFKLLFFGSPDGRESNNSQSDETPKSGLALLPLEKIWEGLDLASQKAIANTYDDGSLEVLESAPDFRSDIFSVSSMFYCLLTGELPPDALERSIEILDGNPDPLVPPHLLDTEISHDLSEFLMKAMRLRREDRFESFDRARRQISAFGPIKAETVDLVADIFDDVDLLEIPGFSQNASSEVNTPIQVAVATVESVVPPRNGSTVTQYANIVPTPETQEIPSPSAPASFAELADEITPVYSSSFTEKPTMPTFSSSPVTDEFDAVPSARHWLFSPLPLVAAAIVVIGVSWWAVTSMNAVDQPSTASQMETKSSFAAEPAVPSEPVDVPANMKTPADTTNIVPVENQPNNTKDTAITNPSNPAPVKSRPAIADVKPPKKTENPGASTPKPKKKVTVDDLISDN